MQPFRIIKTRREAEEVAQQIIENVKDMPQQLSATIVFDQPHAVLGIYKYENLTDEVLVTWTDPDTPTNAHYITPDDLSLALWKRRKSYNNHVRQSLKKENQQFAEKWGR